MSDYEDAYAEGSEHEMRAGDNGPALPARDRVQAGMEFLDKAAPGHVEMFQPENFDIMNQGGDFKRCVLMQATDQDYWFQACVEVGLNPLGERGRELGFYPYGERTGTKDFAQDVRELNAAWLAAYAERQAA